MAHFGEKRETSLKPSHLSYNLLIEEAARHRAYWQLHTPQAERKVVFSLHPTELHFGASRMSND